MDDLGLKFSQHVQKRCMKRCAKNGGAPCCFLLIFCEKPEGGVQTPPAGREGAALSEGHQSTFAVSNFSLEWNDHQLVILSLDLTLTQPVVHRNAETTENFPLPFSLPPRLEARRKKAATMLSGKYADIVVNEDNTRYTSRCYRHFLLRLAHSKNDLS